jgi:glutathione S-transferase
MQLTHTPEERRDEALISKQRKRFTTFARTLNAHLEGKQWICGDHFTVADCVVRPFLPFSSGGLTSASDWVQRVVGIDHPKGRAPG